MCLHAFYDQMKRAAVACVLPVPPREIEMHIDMRQTDASATGGLTGSFVGGFPQMGINTMGGMIGPNGYPINVWNPVTPNQGGSKLAERSLFTFPRGFAHLHEQDVDFPDVPPVRVSRNP